MIEVPDTVFFTAPTAMPATLPTTFSPRFTTVVVVRTTGRTIDLARPGKEKFSCFEHIFYIDKENIFSVCLVMLPTMSYKTPNVDIGI
jgi:hypothetical protein